MKGYIKKIILLAIISYLPLQSMAWGMLGHRILAEIADSYLNSRTRKEIRKVLGNESLAMVSNWADFIKAEPSYNYISNWHYINLPAGLSQSELESKLASDTSTNAYTRINFLSTELRNDQLEPDKKQMYLKLLIHLVGDIHQPMHTGRFEDLGGNRVQLTWFNEGSNLHRVWDSDLIESQQLSYTEYSRAINFIEAYQLKSLQRESVGHWIYDSYQISEQIYSRIKSGDKIGYRYIYDNISIAENQLRKGGIRLAGLLNAIYSR